MLKMRVKPVRLIANEVCLLSELERVWRTVESPMVVVSDSKILGVDPRTRGLAGNTAANWK